MTIAELVLVLVFVAALVIVAVVAVRGIEEDATGGNCRTELRRIKVATEQFFADTGAYPPNKAAIVSGKYAKAADIGNHTLGPPARTGAEPTYRPTGACA